MRSSPGVGCLSLSAVVLLSVAVSLPANPLGGVVVGGDANAAISGQGTAVTTINQTADRAIINWQDFSIGLGELTQFIQPGANAAALNRVISGNPSQILGSLQANGSVYLINQNGILVGPNATINVGTFIGSTLDLADDAFLSGAGMTFSGSSRAGVENLGTINALGGDIFLFGHTVKNSGTLKADGTVGLAAGMSIELRQTGNERLGVLLGNNSAPQTEAGVDNSGLVEAASAEIKAAGGNIYALAINNGGVVRAQPKLVFEGGKLVLRSEGGTVVNTGTLDASNPNGKGGEIQVLGDKVGLGGNAAVNASGATGGGTILIGGDFQGANPEVLNASRTVVGPQVTLSADATSSGDGGKVIVWADGLTRFHGAVSARGGASGGHGGLIEVSGKEFLGFSGSADVGAAAGLSGSILLDPGNATIQAAGANDGLLADSLLDFNEPDTTTAVTISAGAITALTGNFTIRADDDLTINAALALNNLGAGETGNFEAGGSLTINQTVTSNGGTLRFEASSTGGANSGTATLTVNAAVGSAGTGVMIFDNDGSGGIVLNAGLQSQSAIILNNTVTLGTDINITAPSTTFGASANVEALNAGVQGLTITGLGIFNSTLGANTPLEFLTVTAQSQFNGNVTVSGAVSLTDAVTLNGNTTFTSTGGGAITFGSTINGAAALGASTAGTTTFSGQVGGGTALTSVNVSGAGSIALNATSVSTTGTQTYDGAVTVNAPANNTSLTGTSISFNSTLRSLTDGEETLTITGSGTTTFGGAVGDNTQRFASLTSNGGGTTAINGGSVTTTGAQTYTDNVTLGAATVISSSAGGAVAFNGTIDNGQTLSVTTTGTATFAGSVGAGVNLTSLTVDANGGITVGTDTASVSVITTGAQDYDNDAVTIRGSVTFQGTDGTFTGGIAGNGGGDDDLTLNFSADTTLPGIVNLATIRNLATGGGGLTIINNDISVSGSQTYGDNVRVDASVVFASTGNAAITFNGTLNPDATGNNWTVAVNTGGTTSFNGAVGSSAQFESLTTDAGGTTQIGANITTDGASITFNDAVTLAGNIILTENGTGDIKFNSTVGGAFSLTVNTTGGGDTIFNGAVSGLTSVTTDAAGNTLVNANITTSGAQTYNDPLTLTGFRTFTSSGGGDLTFNGTVDGNTAGTDSFVTSTTGTTTLDQAVGGGTDFSGVSFGTGPIVINGGAVTTSNGAGGHTYSGAVTLGANTALTALNGGTINLQSTVNGAFPLNLNTTGNTIIAGQVGTSGTPLTSLTTDAMGNTTISADIFAATQTYNDDVFISGTVTLTGTTGTFNDSLQGDGGGNDDLTLNFSADNTLPGTLGLTNIRNLTTGNGGNTLIDGNITTSGTQTYNDAVEIQATVNLTGTTVTFNNTLNSQAGNNYNLTVTGNAVFGNGDGDAVGAVQPLGTLDVTGATTINSTAATDITTTGGQSYGDGVSSASDAITLGADTTLSSTGGGLINFRSTVDSAPGELNSLTVNTSGLTQFEGVVGGTDRLSSITTDAAGMTWANANINVNSATATTFNDAFMLRQNLTIDQDGAGNVNFVSTVDSETTFNRTLTVNTAGGAAIFGGAVGSDALGAFSETTGLGSVTTAGTGSAQINGGSVLTTGTQTYGTATTLGADTTLTGSTITFNSTLNSSGANRDLIVAGNAVFGDGSGSDTVGGALQLDVINVTGNTTFNLDGSSGGFQVRSTGNQTYGDNAAVDLTVLSAATSFNSSSDTITFNSTINGGFALSFNQNIGTVIFNGAVGNSVPLASVTDPSNGEAIQINGGQIRTTGAISFDNNPITINAAANTTTLESTGGGAITLGGGGHFIRGTVDGAEALTITTSGTTTLNSSIGSGGLRLASLTVNGGGTVNIGAATITTTGAQQYDDNVSLTAGVVMTGVNVTFNGTVNNGQTLTVTDSGTTTFAMAVGGTTRLTSLTVNGGGTTAINGGTVRTTGNQTYTDNVTLGAATTLDSSGGSVAFSGTLSGAFTLSVTAAGTTAPSILFDGTVSTLTSLTANAANGVTIDADVTVAGPITINTDTDNEGNGAFLISSGTTQSTGAGNDITITAATFNITGATALTSADMLTITASNNRDIGLGNAARSLTVDNGELAKLTAPGGTIFNSSNVGPTAIEANGAVFPASAGNITLNATSTGDVAFTTAATTVGGGLTVNATGADVLVQADVTSTTGAITLNGGTIQLGGDLQTDGMTITLNSGAGIVVTASSVIDTEVGDNGNAGAVSITATSISANAAGLDLTLNAATAGAFTGGAINLVNMGNAAGNRLNDIVIDSRGNGGTQNGIITGAANLSIRGNDDGGGDFASLTISGDLRLNGANSFDLSDDTATGGSVDLQNATVSATAANTILSIDTRGVTAQDGGQVDLGLVNNAGGSFLDDLTVQSTGASGTHGTINLWNGAITTTDDQTYTGPVMLQVNTTLTGDTITFNNTLNGNFTLQITDSGVTSFNGTVGGTMPLSTLTTDSAGSVTINTTAINAQGGTVTFNDPVTLTMDVVVTDTGATGVFFNNTVESDATPRALTVNSGAITHFGGAVGAANPLASVTTDAGGTTEINGGLVRSTGGQSYGDNVTVNIGAGTSPTAINTTAGGGNGDVDFDGTLTLNDLAGANDLTITAGTGNVTFTGQVTINDNNLTVVSSSRTIITTGIAGTTGDVDISASFAGANAIDLTGAIALGSSGSIVRLNVTGAGATVAQGGDIGGDQLLLEGTGGFTLDNAGNDVNTLAANTTGAISFRDADGLDVGTVSGVNGVVSTSTVTLRAGGAVTQSQRATGTTLTVLTLNNAGANIILDNANNEFATVDLRARDAGDTANAAGTISYRDLTGFDVAALQTSNGAALRAGGTVTHSGAIVADQLQLLGSGPFTLNTLANDVNTLSASTSELIYFTDSDDLVVGSTTVNGNMVDGITTTDDNVRLTAATTIGINNAIDVTTAQLAGTLTLDAGGAVTQTAAVHAAGLQLLGAGPFTLMNSGNEIIVLSANTTGDTKYADASGFFVGTAGDAISAFSGATVTGADLTLQAGGAVSQTAGTITAAGLELLGAGSFNLTTAGNDAATIAASLTTDSTGTLAYTDANALTVGTVTGQGTVGIATVNANVTLTAGGALTIGDGGGQDITAGTATVDLNVAGATEGANSIITAGSLRLQGTGNFTLTEANDVNTIAASIDGTLNFTDSDDLTVGTVLGTDGITTSDDTVALTAGGALTLTQFINVGTTAAAVNLTAGGHITQSAAGAITANNATFTADHASDTADSIDILLGTAANTVPGAVAFAESAADELRDVAWRNINAAATWPDLPNIATINDLTIIFDSAAIVVDDPDSATLTLEDVGLDKGDLVLTAGGGSITQADTMVIPGTTTLTATGVITLADAANDFGGMGAGTTFVVTIVTGTDVTLVDANDINIDGGQNTGMSSLTVTANGGDGAGGVFGTIFITDATPLTTPTIQTVNNQAYNGNVVLQQDTVLTSTGNGDITFAGTVNSDAAGTPRDLTVNTGGITSFDGGNLGNAAPLDTLTTDDATPDGGSERTELRGAFITVTHQTFNDPVVLEGNVVNTSTGNGNITYATTINGDADGAWGLTVNTGGRTIFGGAIGLGANGVFDGGGDDRRLTDLETDFQSGPNDRTEIGGVTIAMEGGTAVTFNDPVLLTANLTIHEAAFADVIFVRTLDSDVNGPWSLTVNTTGGGETRFGGAVGNDALGALSHDSGLASVATDAAGNTRIDGGIITTTGSQTYLDPVLIGDPDGDPLDDSTAANLLTQAAAESDAGYLNSRTILTSSGGGAIRFGGTIDDDETQGEANLIVNTSGITRFDGLVGVSAANGSTALTTLILGPSGATKDSGDETHINSTATHTFPTTTAQLDAVTKVTNIRTVGFQTYNDDIKLAPAAETSTANADVILRAGPGATVTIVNRVDGDVFNEQGLTVHADTVAMTTAEIGILVQLQFLDVSAGPTAIATTSLTQDTEIQWLVGTAIIGNVNANGFDLTITANDITFVGGAGSITPGMAPPGEIVELTLRPIDPAVAINIGPSVDIGGTFSLSQSDLGAIADGFGLITIGRFDGANNITVREPVTFTDPLRLEAPAVGGSINVNARVISTATPAEARAAADFLARDQDAANATILVNSFGLGPGTSLPHGAGVLIHGPGSTTTLAANIDTSNTPIVINDSVILAAHVTLNTTAGASDGAEIVITGSINDDAAVANEWSLTLIAGTDTTAGGDGNISNIDLRGAIGDALAIGGLTITSAHDVDIDSTVVSSFFNQLAGTGTTVLRGSVTTSTAAGVNLTTGTIVLGDDGDDSFADATPQFDGDGAVNGITITTGGNPARFNGPVTLVGGDITVTTAAGVITFESTVNGAQNLDVSANGAIQFRGLVGGGTALTSLDVLDADADVTTGVASIDGGGVTTTGAQNYGNNVTVGVVDATFASSGGAGITFSGTLNGGQAVTVNTTGATTFSSTVGNTLPLTSLVTDAAGGTTISGATVTTSGTQTYNDTVTLTTGVNFTGSIVSFNDGAVGGANALTVTGNAVFGDAAADSIASGTLLVTGATTVNAATVDTTGFTQTYTGDVTLGGTVTFTGTTVTFLEDILGGANGLAIVGDAVFGDAANDAVTSGTLLVTGATLFNSGTVTTAGTTQTYTGNATLASDVTLTGATVTFNGTVNGVAAGAQSLTITGAAVFGNDAGDTVGAATPLEFVSVSGATTFNGASVTTSTAAGGAGSQTYTGAAILGTGLTLTAGGSLTFGSTLTGNFDLTLAVSGATTFTGAVGGATAATAIGDGAGAAITINSGGATEFASTVNAASGIVQGAAAGTVTFRDSVTIAGTGDTDSLFNNSVVLDGLTFTSGDAVTFGSSAADVVTLSGSAVTLAITGVTTVNAAVNGNQDLVINSTGATGFLAAVGGTTAATEIGDGTGASITFGAGAGAVTFSGTVRVQSGFSQAGTAGLVTFTDNVTVSNGDTASAFSGSVTLDGLTFTSARGAAFGDAAADTITLSTSDVTITATSAGADGAVTFNGSVNGAVALTVNSAGVTTFNATVGPAITTLTTDSAGSTTINATTVGAAVLDFNDAVLIETTTTLTGTTSVDFASTLNSAAAEANSVTVNSPTTAFHGVVGGNVGGALGTLTTDAAGTTTIDTTAVTGAVLDFNDAVVADVDTTLAGTTSVDFASTLNSAAGEANDVTINSPTTAFHGIVGGAAGGALGTLSTDAAGTTTIDTTAVTGAVLDFNDAVVADVDTTLTGTTSVDFASTLNSAAGEANDVIINSPTTAFHGIVGGAAGGALGTLTTDAAGITTIDTTAVTGAVLDFNDAVVISQDATLTGTTSVDFASTLNSDANENNDLTINSPTTAFHGVVGAASPFDILTTDAAGTTTIDTTAVTGAVLDFNDAVVADVDTTLTGTTSVDFASTLNSAAGEANDVIINSPTTAFHGIVGGAAGGALGTLTTDAAGITTIDTTAVTGAVLDFNDAVVADVDTTLAGTTSVDFASTLNSAAGEANDVIINSPTTAFHGIVGGAAGGALGTLTTDAAGTTTIDTTAVTGAVLDFNDAILVDTDAVLTGTTSVDFAATVNSSAGEANDLSVVSPITAFHGIVGGAAGGALGTLTTDAAGTTTIDTSAVTGAVLDFNDAVVADVDTTLTGTTSVDFASTLNSAAGEANDVIINSPTTAFHGIVGGAAGGALGTLSTDAAGTTTIDTTAVTGAVLDFNDAVRADVTTTLTGTTSVDFASTLDSTTGEANSVTVNSPATAFHGVVGGNVGGALGTLTTDAAGTTTIDTTAVTGAVLDFNDAVVADVDTTLTGTTSVDFASTLNSAAGEANDVTINSPTTAFHGIVGGAAGGALGTLSTDAAGTTTIDTTAVTGAVLDFNDAVVADVDTTLTGTTSVDFASTLNSAAGEANDVIINSPTTAFHGIVGGAAGGALGTLSTDAAGTTTIDTTAVTGAVLDFNDAIVLSQNTTLTGTTSVDFASTVNSDAAATPRDVTVNSPITGFHGIVGGAVPLGTLTTDAAGITTIDTAAITGAVLDFNDAVAIDTSTTLTGTTSVDFATTLNSAAGEANSVTINSPTTAFHGIVGGAAGGALGTLTTDAAGITTIDTTAVTGAVLDFNDAVVADVTTTLTGTTSVDFASTLNSAAGEANSVTINSPTTAFHGIVGGAAGGALGTLTTDAAGITTIDTTAVTGAVLDFNDAVLVDVTTTLTGTTSVDFALTLNSVAGEANSVTVNSPVTGFQGAVGTAAGGALGSLTTDAPGITSINGGAITTTGAQTYNDAVTIGAGIAGTTTLTSTAAGPITFVTTLDDDGTAAASNLVVNNSGATTFGGVVGGIGGITPLTSITTLDSTGAAFSGLATDVVAINGGAVTTTGAQTYNEHVTLGANTVLTSTAAGDITIGVLGPNGIFGPTTLTTTAGAPVTLAANGTANFKVNAAVNGVITMNGTVTTSYIAPNSSNTGINLFLSNPVSALVFIFSQPPAEYKINGGVIDMGLLFGRDAAILFGDPTQGQPLSTLTVDDFEYLAAMAAGRSGLVGSDKVVSIFDFMREEELRRRNQ